MRSLADYIDAAEAAVAGRLDSRNGAIAIVNDAGTHMVSSHAWPWLVRPPLGLPLVAGQTFISLPDDFRRLISLEVAGSSYQGIEETSLSRLVQFRESFEVDTGVYLYALSYRSAGTPQLEIFPTPASSEANAFTLVYEAGWLTLTNNGQVPAMPADMEPLLVEYVRAFARGSLKSEFAAKMIDGVDGSGLSVRLKQRYGVAMPGNVMPTASYLDAVSPPAAYRPHRTISR
jgi:hypothetical protein